ncbi:MAG: hypothetical protein KDD35_10790, partial [Bdellovibrionales bacterium]|nr:hypothetical protein [Bdellovibrionales bacterium]
MRHCLPQKRKAIKMTIFARSSIKITTGKSKSICREGRYDDSNYRDVKFICDRAETIEVPEE